MVTDTALYRYPYYHTAEDTPDRLDYGGMSRAVTGLAALVRDLASQMTFRNGAFQSRTLMDTFRYSLNQCAESSLDPMD